MSDSEFRNVQANSEYAFSEFYPRLPLRFALAGGKQ